MLAEFLIELRLHEEQDKIAQIVTGSSSTVKHSMYENTAMHHNLYVYAWYDGSS